MRRLALYLSAALLLASCGDVIEIPEVTPPEPVKEDTEEVNPLAGELVFTASAENLPDGSIASWKKGERILLFDGSTTHSLLNTAEDGPVARFPVALSGTHTAFTAIYPAVEGASLSATGAAVPFPAVRSAAEAPLLYKIAKSTGKTLYFRNLLCEISFTVGFDGVTKVRLEAAGGEKIAGDFTVDYTSDTPVVTGSSSVVEISGNFEKGVTYTVALVPCRLSGYSVTAFAGDAEKAHLSGGEITLVPGGKAALEQVGQDIPTYRITNLWIWGGTGPEYNCTKIYDLFTKPGCWNAEDGRGVTALKDNYLELRPNGTFMNWAGEDGRNWWFVFSGANNLENGKDVDCKAFYDLLPRGEGSYSVNGENISFTSAAGTATGKIVPAGSYVMPGTTPPLQLTIAEGHMAIMFAISGGKDNWTYTWQDYGVMVCRPRALFFEVEQLPAGFVTPDTSRTTDTEFEYVAPEDPGSLFDWDGLEASWNVRGGNSAPFGIWVLGGSGNDPAFVSPIDKSWDWDDSIYRESDNGLVVKVSSRSSTEIKGTTNWWAGADGKFWNYIWKKTGEDLSRFYDKIPKGEKDFTLDLKKMEITLGNGNKAKFLTPGLHTFAYNKTLEVPDGCFALAFHLKEPIDATADRWTDVDRFINAPLEYVIIFEK